ncbi:helix-turn-helix transcriptional regulator [Mucilaginibacter sp. 21P]|uniref:helix-turn-helix domain-containing protein n=1 Tax=Mucilaginibacter sp. 21P TaxID=2778902 RepID=UPI001C55AB4A|nr:helix-turn-helix transcriptional regulator [Mucilaginibacter sp. 21P]QXV63646.1 helix-turn-helix transcriptional regulator [Mucilaginibacter sp. 21P]
MRKLYIEKTNQTLINVRKMREARGLSQRFMADRLFISQNAYSKFELGYTTVKLEHIYAIAVIFDVKISDIIII